jgi:SH3-like domain-containing protein
MLKSFLCLFAALAGSLVFTTPANTLGPSEVNVSRFSEQLVPRWASVSASEANGRMGPTFDHPVEWQYQRRGMPVEIIEETEGWRRVRDPMGDTVWMKNYLLQSDRSVMVRTQENSIVPLFARAQGRGKVVANAASDVIFDLERCREGWCLVRNAQARGWISAEALYGLYPEEAMKLG